MREEWEKIKHGKSQSLLRGSHCRLSQSCIRKHNNNPNCGCQAMLILQTVHYNSNSTTRVAACLVVGLPFENVRQVACKEPDCLLN